MLHDKTLLLVDDDPDTLESILQGLTVLTRAHVTAVSSGAAALQQLRKQRFDILVTDFRMPGMDGLELTKRAHRIVPGLPVLMITAFNSEELHEAAAKAGVCEVLPKPVDVNPLVQAVTACC